MLASRSDQYAEERAEVEVLLAKAKKHAELGKQIQANLTRMKERDGFWQQAKSSIYNDTQGSRVVNRNVEAILASVARFRQPLEGKADEERTIRDGPGAVGMRAYLQALKRLQQRHAELMNNGIRSNTDAAHEIGTLLSQGEQQIGAQFDGIVGQSVAPIEPLQFMTKNVQFPVLPEEQTRQLSEINSHFGSSHHRQGPRLSDASRSYAQMRGDYLRKSCENLALATISTARSTKVEEIYKANTCSIGPYAQALEGMLKSEWQNIAAIFSREERALVLASTADKAIEGLKKALGEIIHNISANKTTAGFLAFEVIETISTLAYKTDEMSTDLKQKILDASQSIREFAKAVLKELIEDIRRRLSAMMFLPKNSAAIPFTNEVMRRLQTLQYYPNAFSSVLTSIGDKNWLFLSDGNNPSNPVPLNKAFDVGPDGTRIIANYCLDTIEVLCDLLEGKGRSLTKDKPLFGLFLANNVATIEAYMRSEQLARILPAATRGNKLEIWRKKGISSYTDAWREPCSALMDVQYTNRGPRPASGGANVDSAAIVKALNSKDKDAIKKKFDHFNLVFADLLSKHKEYTPAMHADIRAQLAEDIRTMVLPLYTRFYDRYFEIDKGKGKHVKYDKNNLSQQLASL